MNNLATQHNNPEALNPQQIDILSCKIETYRQIIVIIIVITTATVIAIITIIIIIPSTVACSILSYILNISLMDVLVSFCLVVGCIS
jgi:hypothetical protein